MARQSVFLVFATSFFIGISVSGCEVFTDDPVSEFDHPFTASFGDVDWEGEGSMTVVESGTVRISGQKVDAGVAEIVFLTISEYRGVEYYQLASEAGIVYRRNGVETLIARILPSPSNSAAIEFQNADIARGSYSFIAEVVNPSNDLVVGEKIGVSGSFTVKLPFRD